MSSVKEIFFLLRRMVDSCVYHYLGQPALEGTIGIKFFNVLKYFQKSII